MQRTHYIEHATPFSNENAALDAADAACRVFDYILQPVKLGDNWFVQLEDFDGGSLGFLAIADAAP